MKTQIQTQVHFEEPIPQIGNTCSHKKNSGATVPISTFMCLWVIYVFPRSICLFCCRIYVDRSWEYINRSQTHECGFCWDWGRAIPRKNPLAKIRRELGDQRARDRQPRAILEEKNKRFYSNQEDIIREHVRKLTFHNQEGIRVREHVVGDHVP